MRPDQRLAAARTSISECSRTCRRCDSIRRRRFNKLPILKWAFKAVCPGATVASSHGERNKRRRRRSSNPPLNSYYSIPSSHVGCGVAPRSRTRSAVGGPTMNPNPALFDSYTFNREPWHVSRRYASAEPINAGAFGTVCKAVDRMTNKPVAIKRINQPFKTDIHARRTLRELKLLRFFNHDNLLNLIDAFTTSSSAEFMNDLYLITPYMDTDLAVLIKQHHQAGDGGRLSDEHIQFFTYQILRGLKFLHSANIIHRDLKPANIAVTIDCYIKIIDYGLCRAASDEMTGYVATRWYRAPEIMLDWTHYSFAVDIWAVGCMLAEMFLGRPLFPESDHIDLIRAQVHLCGTPNQETLASFESEQAVDFIQTKLANKPRQNFSMYFQGASPRALDLLEKMLQMDPRHRIGVTEALAHPYLSDLHDVEDELTCMDTFDDRFELQLDNVQDATQRLNLIREWVFHEIQDIQRNGPVVSPVDVAAAVESMDA